MTPKPGDIPIDPEIHEIWDVTSYNDICGDLTAALVSSIKQDYQSALLHLDAVELALQEWIVTVAKERGIIVRSKRTLGERAAKLNLQKKGENGKSKNRSS